MLSKRGKVKAILSVLWFILAIMFFVDTLHDVQVNACFPAITCWQLAIDKFFEIFE